MKKYVFLFLMIMLGYHASSYAQAVDDRAVIPVAVTLNSILRLNVKSGGNIEFNFNTLHQYSNGIVNSPEYDTKIEVASSVDWRLKMGAEDQALLNTVDTTAASGRTMPLGFIGYTVADDGGTGTSSFTTSLTPLDEIGNDVYIIENSSGNAGGPQDNAFTIHWECATGGNILGPLLGENYSGGRYATNVFFILENDPT